MPWSEDLQRDADSAMRDAQRLQGDLLEFAELRRVQVMSQELDLPIAGDIEEFQARVAELLERLQRILGRLREGGGNAARESPIQVASLANELQEQLAWLQQTLQELQSLLQAEAISAPGAALQSLAASVGGALRTTRNRLIPLLRKFLAKLWHVIAGLLTPKEWTLKGKIGTGPFGLADVGIEIKFGP